MDCIQDLLFHPEATDVERMRKIEPWNLLLLFKWVILFGDVTKTSPKYQVTEDDFAGLLNDMKSLSSKVFLMRTDEDRFLYFRALCFQQFWVNRPESIYLGIARQYVLFANLESGHRFQRWFVDRYGLRIDEFIELSLAVYTHFDQTEVRLVDESNFAPLRDSYGVKAIKQFLDTVSISISDSQEWLRSLEVGSHSDFRSEFHEQSPFLRYPFLRSPDGYICISPHLLFRSLSSLVYDLLREAFPADFSAKFGSMFERYVHNVLKTCLGVLITEDQIQCDLGLPERQKYVDFLLVEHNINVFIETKGVALPPKEVAKTVAKYGGKEWIPIENIFFISIDEFDLLIGSTSSCHQAISDVLGYTKRTRANSISKLFAFRDHIPEACGAKQHATARILFRRD